MKALKKIFIILVLIVCIVVTGYMSLSYQKFKNIQEQKSIQQCVIEVQNQANYVSYEYISQDLIHATVAIEDRRFYNHGGVDFIGVGRALVSQFSDSFIRSGGSTITQQTVKNLYGLFDGNFLDKGCQVWMAWELESICTKEEILAIYLNIINYGDYNFGIYEASTNYFGVYPSELSLAQATLLAGIPNLPGYYQLSNHYENAKQRQYNVLVCMEQCGYIEENQIDSIYNESVYVNNY